MIKIWIAGLLAVAAAGAAVAEDGPGKMFDRADANGDGQLTRAETVAFGDRRFERADANGDGLLTLEELTAAASRRNADRIAKRIERVDANGDGAIAREEARARGDVRFQRLDENGDGVLTVEEVRKGRKAWLRHQRDG